MEKIGQFIDKGETVLVNILSVLSVVVLDIYSEMPTSLIWIIGLSIAFFNIARGISALRKKRFDKLSDQKSK